MNEAEFQMLASTATVLALPIAILAFLLQVIVWYHPSPSSLPSLNFLYKIRFLLSYIVIIILSVWVGSKYTINDVFLLNLSIAEITILAFGSIGVLAMFFLNSKDKVDKSDNSFLIKINREGLIKKGLGLASNAKKMVVMFGSDMSVAQEYERTIRKLTSEGKEVLVIFEESRAGGVVNNTKILKNSGATLIKTSLDTGIRGMLIDPEDQSSILFITDRQPKPNKNEQLVEGNKSSDSKNDYFFRIYNKIDDEVLIKGVYSFSKHLKEKL